METTSASDQNQKEIDYLEDFALFLLEAERSPVTLKNYLCDLNYFAKWFEQPTTMLFLHKHKAPNQKGQLIRQ
ncbi:MAG: hypothetical protein WA919_05815 [Coleofasciculaceae cyanobacterium]